MSLNIAGVVVDANFDKNIDKIQALLGYRLTFDCESDFEDATDGWVQDGTCFVYAHGDKTLILLPMDDCSDGFEHPDLTVLTFALSETSMAFNLSYSEGTAVVRSIMSVNGTFLVNEGTPSAIEQNITDVDEIIMAYIKNTLGIGFYDIDEEQEMSQYTLSRLA